MANFRNYIAHGNLSFGEIFQQAGRAVADIERYMNDISEFVMHLISEWFDYLESQRYLAAYYEKGLLSIAAWTGSMAKAQLAAGYCEARAR